MIRYTCVDDNNTFSNAHKGALNNECIEKNK